MQPDQRLSSQQQTQQQQRQQQQQPNRPCNRNDSICSEERTVHASIACSEFDPCLFRRFDSCALVPAYKVLAHPIGSSSMKDW